MKKTAIILTMTSATHKMDTTAIIILPVDSNKMKKAKATAMIIPYTAFWTNMDSDGMNVNAVEP